MLFYSIHLTLKDKTLWHKLIENGEHTLIEYFKIPNRILKFSIAKNWYLHVQRDYDASYFFLFSSESLSMKFSKAFSYSGQSEYLSAILFMSYFWIYLWVLSLVWKKIAYAFLRKTCLDFNVYTSFYYISFYYILKDS